MTNKKRILGLCAALLCSSMVSFAQSVQIRLSNATVSKAMAELREKSGYSFVYEKADVNTNRRVNVNASTLQEAISQILADQPVNYELKGKNIVVSRHQTRTNSTYSTHGVNQANKRRVTGHIVDANGEPIIGASVKIQGNTKASGVTNVDGEFTIEAASGQSVEISYMGFTTKTIAVNSLGQGDNKITLDEDRKIIDEVVVIGYGAVKKSDLTGAVASVKGEDLVKTATSSPIAALQGRAAGVVVDLGSGSPDATPLIHIRGVGTPNNSSPLYVVDGFPMDAIDFLNPNDIESIEILKDASATAIYGSRGANGVIIIQTKKGQAGTLRVNATAYYGIENLTTQPDMLNAQQYEDLANAAYAAVGKPAVYSGTPKYNTDWVDETTHSGTIQQYNINLSGGTDKLQSVFSANYFDHSGIIRSTNFNRITLSSNNTYKPTKWLDFNATMHVSTIHSKRLDPSYVLMTSLIAPPDDPVWDEESNYYYGITKFRLENPAGAIGRNTGRNRSLFFVGNFSINIRPVKDVTFTSRYGVKIRNLNNISFTPVYYETQNISNLMNTVGRGTGRFVDWTWENQLTWHHNFNHVHDITVMGATSARKFHTDNYDVTKQNIPNESDNFWYFDAASENPLASGNGAELTMLSYLGRINYTLLDRYLLTASIRADGSSRFTKENRWGYFPSASLAWRISSEPFFQNWGLNWWNNAKLRVGYGEIGNENINSYYPYLNPVSQQNYYVIGKGQVRTNGASPSGIGNPDTQWETSKQFDLGLDLGFFDTKLTITADYYIRKTNNILLSQQIPSISGFSTVVRNVGGMENRGFEFAASYTDKVGDFHYTVSGNFATVNNKVTDLGTSSALIGSIPYIQALIDLQGSLGNMLRSEVGGAYNRFYGYKTDGIFQSEQDVNSYIKDGKLIQPNAKPGDFKFQDINGDGKIDDGDRTFIGNPIPDVTFGLSLNADWHNFDLSALFSGSLGNDIYNGAKYYFMRFDGKQNVRNDYLNAYWHGQGTSNDVPILTSDATRNDNNFKKPSDWYVENGSYLRLKTLQIGYTFYPRFADGFKSSIRVYFQAQNLFTITSYSGLDPEISSDYAVDRGQYPQPRTFMLGTNINF